MQRGGASPPFAEVFLGCLSVASCRPWHQAPRQSSHAKKESVPGSRSEDPHLSADDPPVPPVVLPQTRRTGRTETLFCLTLKSIRISSLNADTIGLFTLPRPPPRPFKQVVPALFLFEEVLEIRKRNDCSHG